MKTIWSALYAIAVVGLLCGFCAANAIFSGSGSLRTGESVDVTLDLLDDTVLLEISSEDGGLSGDFFSDLVRFAEAEGTPDLVILTKEGTSGGQVAATGEHLTGLIPLGETPTLDMASIYVYDDSSGFDTSATITSWETIAVPEAASLLVAGLGLFGLLIFGFRRAN